MNQTNQKSPARDQVMSAEELDHYLKTPPSTSSSTENNAMSFPDENKPHPPASANHEPSKPKVHVNRVGHPGLRTGSAFPRSGLMGQVMMAALVVANKSVESFPEAPKKFNPKHKKKFKGRDPFAPTPTHTTVTKFKPQYRKDTRPTNRGK